MTDAARRAAAILTFDGAAGLVAGLIFVTLRGPIAVLYGWPSSLVLFVAAANLLYGSSSSVLGWRARRGAMPARRWIDGLVAANLSWALVCLALLTVTAETSRGLGMAQLVAEAAFVAALALAEIRWVRPHAPAM